MINFLYHKRLCNCVTPDGVLEFSGSLNFFRLLLLFFEPFNWTTMFMHVFLYYHSNRGLTFSCGLTCSSLNSSCPLLSAFALITNFFLQMGELMWNLDLDWLLSSCKRPREYFSLWVTKTSLYWNTNTATLPILWRKINCVDGDKILWTLAVFFKVGMRRGYLFCQNSIWMSWGVTSGDILLLIITHPFKIFQQ